MILFERFNDGNVHIAELTAVALVEDDDDVFFEDGMPLVFFNEDVEFLNGGDNNSRVRIFELSFKNGGGSIAIRRALLETVVFLHGLIVQVFSVDHKQNLVDISQCGRQLRRFEGSQRFTAARRVPDIAPAGYRAVLLIIVGHLDFI